MIYLAYDGSINGDWVARYAVSLAHSSIQKLVIIHVTRSWSGDSDIANKIVKLEELCRKSGIETDVRIKPFERSVEASIIETIDPDATSLCICGTRIREKKKGYLSGTISEKLLNLNRFPVLALRVVHPGLLGNPRDILLAASASPAMIRRSLPLRHLMLHEAKSLHIVRIMELFPLFYRNLSHRASRRIRLKGTLYVKQIHDYLKTELADNLHIDTRLDISDNWPSELLVQAGKLKSDLILLGATRKLLQRRFRYANRLERILRDTPCDIGIYTMGPERANAEQES